MKYFHRTALSPDAALDAAKAFFGSRMAPAEESPRRRAFAGPLGKVTVAARAEGGHYTFVEVGTDQVGESEIDRLARRFLAELPRQLDRGHELLGRHGVVVEVDLGLTRPQVHDSRVHAGGRL